MITAHPVTHLLQEIERYLNRLEFPGKAQVVEGLSQSQQRIMQSVKPATASACAHLAASLAIVRDQKLARAIETAAPLLNWTSYAPYPRDEIGPAFADGHAFASLIGEGAFHHADDFDLGLFIIAPRVLYPDHHHAAPELYAPLTGPHFWRFLPNEEWTSIEADIPVWNEPWDPHATRTGSVPFLCIFCWTRDVNVPAKVIAGYGANEGEH